MNYYNPYFYTMPNFTTPKVGIFSKLLGGKGITFSGIISGTQKALNFANQAIPLVKQVKPVIGNAKTMFKVMNEFKRAENRNTKPKNSNNEEIIVTANENTKEKNNYSNNINGPTFFM